MTGFSLVNDSVGWFGVNLYLVYDKTILLYWPGASLLVSCCRNFNKRDELELPAELRGNKILSGDSHISSLAVAQFHDEFVLSTL